ncbi:MAG: DUF2497 domain-containing protein [Acetobacteraceae bacterium]
MSGPAKGSVSKPADPATGPAADPTMEDILASIRRILNEDGSPGQATERREEILVLDDSMMVADPKPSPGPAAVTAPPAEPPPAPPVVAPPVTPPFAQDEMLPVSRNATGRLLAPEAAAAAAAAVGSLVKRLSSERGTAVSRGGPTIEDLVREELRPLLKAWLDANLPALVDRVVRAEIERVLGRAVP